MRGVLADVALPSLTNGMTEGESELPNALPFDSIDPVSHAKYEWMDPEMRQTLRDASEARRVESEVFRSVRSDIELYTELSSRKDVTLNLEKFVALQEELDTSRQRRRELRALISQRGGNADAYLHEVLEIAEDYLTLIRG